VKKRKKHGSKHSGRRADLENDGDGGVGRGGKNAENRRKIRAK
jgi:hypothetical protein